MHLPDGRLHGISFAIGLLTRRMERTDRLREWRSSGRIVNADGSGFVSSLRARNNAFPFAPDGSAHVYRTTSPRVMACALQPRRLSITVLTNECDNSLSSPHGDLICSFARLVTI